MCAPSKCVPVAMFQTELTCQRIQEFETKASTDLELRNTKIDELNRVSIDVTNFIFVNVCVAEQH